MKNFFPLLALIFVLGSCKVSETVTVDSIANAEMLEGYQNFKLVEEDYADKRNERIKLTFRDKLLEYGFEESSENPDFLIQGVVVTRKFIQELGQTSSIPGPFYSANNSTNNSGGGTSGGRSTFVVNRGMIGKVIFLIQDAKTNEIAWMGVSTGVIYGGGLLNPEDLDFALHELLASL
ncbi:DUF4136 domain-containing protein [Algoriphagus aquatilis]|uniref:DUF4136 domain-containing protein n=1 Tax=Algoriphagus aquatilis TaxID=490186 RepID=A0ABW0BTI6_9BACT